MIKFKSLSRIIVVSIFVLVANLSYCPTVEAVLLGDSGWEMIAHSYSEGYVWPVVDAVGPDNVGIELFKEFQGPIEFGASLSHVVEFTKIAPDAKEKIIIIDEYIINNTDSEWFDFHMAIINLGFPMAGFDPQHVPNGDQLEEVFYTAPLPGYAELPTQLNFVNAEGDGVQQSDIFWLGRQDGEIAIITNPQMQVGDSFLLKEWATTNPVPEPATICLLALGALVLRRQKA